MKAGRLIPLLAAPISLSLAQNNAPVYVTTTIDDCPTETGESVVTVTDGVTVTYCPACDQRSTTTVYTTTFLQLCTSTTPYSLTEATYTVTDVCGDAGCTQIGAGYIPPGFTVATSQCDLCATPGPVTLTQPCGYDVTNGVVATDASDGSQAQATDVARSGGMPTMSYTGGMPTSYANGASWGNTSNITPYSSAGERDYTTGIVGIMLGAVLGGLAVVL